MENDTHSKSERVEPTREAAEAAIAVIRNHPYWFEANLIADELEARWTECDDWRARHRMLHSASPREAREVR